MGKLSGKPVTPLYLQSSVECLKSVIAKKVSKLFFCFQIDFVGECFRKNNDDLRRRNSTSLSLSLENENNLSTLSDFY